jgi:hypothetical protein
MSYGSSQNKKPLWDPNYSFPTDANGEPYFDDAQGYRVYPKRRERRHNIAGKMFDPTEFTIKRLGQPNPHTVISQERADRMMGMSDAEFRAYKKGREFQPQQGEASSNGGRTRRTEADRLGIWKGDEIVRGDDVKYLGSRKRDRRDRDRDRDRRSRSESEGGKRKR